MKRRRHILCLLIIMASLFLYSCGIPTICTLSGIKIKPYIKEQNIEFSVTGTDEDLSLTSTNCPGLLMCYVVSDSDIIFETDKSKIASEFASKTTYKVYIDDNNLILTAGDYELYAFQTDISGSRVSSPSYSMNLNPYKSGTSINTDLIFKYTGNRRFYLDGTVSNSALYIHEISDSTKHYIHVFAAFSAEEGTFTNNYWSDLTYLGYIDINN